MFVLSEQRRRLFNTGANFDITDGMSMLNTVVANTHRKEKIHTQLPENTGAPTCGPSDRISEEIHDKILSDINVVTGTQYADSISNQTIYNVNNLIDIKDNKSTFDFEDQMLIASCRKINNDPFILNDKDTYPFYLDKEFRVANINWHKNKERFTKYVPDNDPTEEKRTRLKRLLYIKNNQDEIIGHSASIVDVFPGQWLLPPLPIDGAPKSMTSTFRELKPIFRDDISCSWRPDGTPLFLCTDAVSLNVNDNGFEETFPFSSLTMNDMLFMTHISAMDDDQARVDSLFSRY